MQGEELGQLEYLAQSNNNPMIMLTFLMFIPGTLMIYQSWMCNCLFCSQFQLTTLEPMLHQKMTCHSNTQRTNILENLVAFNLSVVYSIHTLSCRTILYCLALFQNWGMTAMPMQELKRQQLKSFWLRITVAIILTYSSLKFTKGHV